MDIDDGIQAVVVTGQQKFSFDPINELPEFGNRRFQLRFDRFSLACKIDERLRIPHLVRNLAVQGESFLEPCSLLKGFAGAILIRPEAGITDQGLEFIELALAGICVKGTSGRLPRAS
jgi:hypothetical protein